VSGADVDFHRIYRDHADAYDALVAAEDCEGRLRPALEAIVPLAGATVLEVGAGTGRVTRLLLDAGARVVASEPAAAMRAVARRRIARLPTARCALLGADARALPVRAGWADVAVAGWALGHLRAWEAPRWREAIGRALAELARALRPGGTLIVIETLGTGEETPRPPTPELAEYYAWLEGEQGMERAAIRTDYRFPDSESAARALAFFFGGGFAARVLERRWTRIPVCRGVWWRRAGAPRPGAPETGGEDAT
jgi:ubiquinone/menaquinone biosynthesis C-methylase UbiE